VGIETMETQSSTELKLNGRKELFLIVLSHE